MDIAGLAAAGLVRLLGYAAHRGGIGAIKAPLAPICGCRGITDKKTYSLYIVPSIALPL